MTEHEIFLQRKQFDVRKRAQHHWALLRESVRSVKKAAEEAEIRELEIAHGIHRERSLNHPQQITQVLFIPEHKSYLTCDGDHFCFFDDGGHKQGSFQATENINRVVFSSQTNQFVGYMCGQEHLYLMTKDFVIGTQCKAVGKILMATYNNSTGELITVGPHFITFWMFRFGARYLIPRKTITTDFGESNMFFTMVLEEATDQTQKILFAYEDGVVVYNIFCGTEVSHRKYLHSQRLTAMTFFNPYKYVITGSADGCIKVWDEDWKIKMVFVGHSKQVNFLKIYPYGPAFISASLDCTLRVWNMDTCDEIDKTVIDDPIQGIDTQMDYDVFYTYSGNRVDLWKLQHLYYIHTHIGYKVNNIKVTSHPLFPQRAVVLCRDSSVHIICPANGEVITSMLMKQSEGLADAAYAIAEDTIFAVMSSGDIVKGVTNKNPCEIVARWKCSNSEGACNCLLVYEYLVDLSGNSDVFTLAKHVTQRNKARGGRQKLSKNRTLLLGGRKDGYICVIDWLTGRVTFKAEAHGSKGVLSMIANSRSDQLISAGMDNVIKVWRVYPFAQEALAPLMSFYCAQCPSFMTTIKLSLGIAFQNLSTATFSIVLYSLADRNRFDHNPDDDHMDRITGLSSCPRMKLYASSSIDGTVRIWSENNTLLRVLRLNTAIHSIAFCSAQGDLLVGIDNHLFHIPHTKFLPKSYKRKQACMKFLPVKTEQPLSYDESQLNLMDKDDVLRLKNSHASFRHTCKTGISSHEKHTVNRQESMYKDETFELLELREKELKLIRDGVLKAKHKPKSTKETQDTAFREYMKMYYNRQRQQLPLDDNYSETTLLKKFREEAQSVKRELTYLEKAPFGFFMELGQKLLEKNPGSLQHCGYPSAPSGFLPNSVIVKLLHPIPEQKEELKDQTPYKPPELTSKQLAEIQSLYKRQGTGQDSEDLDLTFSRSVTYSEEDHLSRLLEVELVSVEEKREEDKSSNVSILPEKSFIKKLDVAASKTVQRTQNVKRQRKKTDLQSENVNEDAVTSSELGLSEKSALMSKLQAIINKPSSKLESHESSDNLPKPAPVPEKTKHVQQTPLKPVAKLISRPEANLPAATPPRSPSPPVPSTPLPSFITLFVTSEWFHKFFPSCNQNTLPKPWNSDNFISMIYKLIRIADWGDKVNVTDAILYVYAEEGLSESVIVNVARTLVAVLNHHTSPPVCSVTEQKVFILSALKALATLMIKEKDVVVELLVQFLIGDTDVRSAVLDAVMNLGLADPHRQLQKELDSWDIWSIEEARLRKQLHDMCNEWLDRWMTSYKIRIQDSVDLLNQGHSLHGCISSKKSKQARPTEREASVSSQSAVKIRPPTITDVTSDKQRSSVANGSVTVIIDNLHGTSVLQSVSYLDAITYFCEIMTEKELEALKKGQTLKRKQEDGKLEFENTVVVLPRILKKPALVRLGEMHTSQCRPERETCLHTGFHLPPITMRGRHPAPGDLASFVSCINLPMKTVYLNPFATTAEETDSHINQPILITLKSSQKYFIPSHSYVSNEDFSVMRS
ncbi:hypothetical protein BsWGS_16108 [Bradybaena similaris]